MVVESYIHTNVFDSPACKCCITLQGRVEIWVGIVIIGHFNDIKHSCSEFHLKFFGLLIKAICGPIKEKISAFLPVNGHCYQHIISWTPCFWTCKTLTLVASWNCCIQERRTSWDSSKIRYLVYLNCFPKLEFSGVFAVEDELCFWVTCYVPDSWLVYSKGWTLWMAIKRSAKKCWETGMTAMACICFNWQSGKM